MLGKESEAFMEKATSDNQKRKFLHQLRPPYYWNFFEDCKEEDKVTHVLRYNANPVECYKDGRIEKILQSIEEIGMNIKNYEPEKFGLLRKQTLAIFSDTYKKHCAERDNN